MDLTLQLWQLLLIIITCLIASGMISSFILKHLWTKNKDQIVKLSSIQLDLFFPILTIIGIMGIDDAPK